MNLEDRVNQPTEGGSTSRYLGRLRSTITTTIENAAVRCWRMGDAVSDYLYSHKEEIGKAAVRHGKDALWGYCDGLWAGGDLIGLYLGRDPQIWDRQKRFFLGGGGYHSLITGRAPGLWNPKNSLTYNGVKSLSFGLSLLDFSVGRLAFYCVGNVVLTYVFRGVAVYSEHMKAKGQQEQGSGSSVGFQSTDPFTKSLETLGLPENASWKDVRKAYLQLARKYHPDGFKRKKQYAHDRFVEVQNAYEVIEKNRRRLAGD